MMKSQPITICHHYGGNRGTSCTLLHAYQPVTICHGLEIGQRLVDQFGERNFKIEQEK